MSTEFDKKTDNTSFNGEKPRTNSNSSSGEIKKIPKSISTTKIPSPSMHLKTERNQQNSKFKETTRLSKHKTTRTSDKKLNSLNNRGSGNFSSIKKRPSIKVAFLGGLNEIGKNITMFECGNDMFLLDCGMAFPDDEMLGVDLVIPDFSYVIKNKSKIKGLIITHGHEDHIGSIPYLLEHVNIPIYATRLTTALIGAKLKEFGLLRNARLNTVKTGQKVNLGCMSVEFIHVNHSIPDAVGVAIYSPAGLLVHTGDFKIDCTPLNEPMIDLGKFSKLGQQGVLALFADSTNVERPGYTMTEQKVMASFENLFNEAKNKRIIIASFASNISRLLQIIKCAVRYGRKVAFSGRSIINYMTIAEELGYLDIPKSVIIDIDLLRQYPKDKIVLITTGSQGEPMSALARMASSDHRKVEAGPEDFVIISANPIPGNEKTIGAVINDLVKLGCHVVYESMYEVHVSGHACQEELKIIQGLVKPKYFLPVHGEQKHLRRHANLAKSMGILESRILIGDVGSLVEINEDFIKQIGTVPTGKVFVDGSGVGDVGNLVLKERRHLAENGLIVVIAAMNSYGTLISGPEIFSRGFVFVRESETLMNGARVRAMEIFNSFANRGTRERGVLKAKLRDDLSKFFHKNTKRNPMVLPIIMNV
ncbi:MAG: ribonuclease J [Oscillospiraceae bacterium]|nr:ribonuclease J [Oscillospiraceae bacterium]